MARNQGQDGAGQQNQLFGTGEATKFHQAMSCLIEIERRPVEAWVNSLTAIERSRFVKSIAAMSPEQASRAVRDIANCADDNARMDRARADELIGGQEPSILALALLDVSKDDQAMTDRLEQHFNELYQNDAQQYTSLVAQLMLFDERNEIAAVLKDLGKTITLDAFLQKCRNRGLIQ